MDEAGTRPGEVSTPAEVEADPRLERDYQAALDALRNPKRLASGLLLIGSLVAFLLLQQGQAGSVRALVVLVVVLLFHELGHFAAMRLFGYRDVRMFFIPFFGAAVSGKRAGAAPWKEGVVLLLGPLPGILLGFVLALRSASLSPVMHELAVSLVTINTFNLLPLAGLDGARLLQLLLFSRRRWLQVGFQGCAAAGAAVVAVTLQSIALGVLAYLMVIVLPHQWRVLGAARRVREAGIALPLDAAALDGDVGRAVFLEARANVTDLARSRPATVAATMEQIVDAANATRPTLFASFTLGLALFVSFVLGLAGLMLVFASPTF